MSARENRLAREKSPYLLQHARNPVDWFPYGEEAFRTARETDRPIFLSIGYSTCHWCHVMERESFEDEATAALMNARFVNVKVDREERPDVDQVYMQAVLLMTGRGGWPLSAFLTPGLVPFYGGTYFPRDAHPGLPSFREVLEAIAHMWAHRREELLARGDRLLELLRRPGGGGTGEPDPGFDPGSALARELPGLHDAVNGGFGPAPKFPRPALLQFLAHRAVRQDFPEARDMLATTLDAMWRGGIYDHVGGGFCRYSTDAHWLVPHFEKMLYDNAQLVEAYLDGHLLLGREDFARVAVDVLRFVEREMTGPHGGFYSAQDADSEGEEGRFYVFTEAEIDAVLGEEAPRAKQVLGVVPEGNFEGRCILHWPRPVSGTARALGIPEAELFEAYARWRCLLYGHRESRPRPLLDDKALLAWNGLMIAAMARAGAVIGEQRWTLMAARAAEFVEAHLRRPDGGYWRRERLGEARHEASLDDLAALGLGRLALFQATGHPGHLEVALAIDDRIHEEFRDPAGPGLFYAAASPDLIVRMKDAYDGAMPSGNALAALLGARLGAAIGDEGRRDRARRIVLAFSGEVRRHPEGHPLLICAHEELREPPRALHLLASGPGPELDRAIRAAHRELFPGRVIVPIVAAHKERLAALGLQVPDDCGSGGVRALLCEDFTCRDHELRGSDA
jgi:uncharacterized protein YyaL (SSP411 family)